VFPMVFAFSGQSASTTSLVKAVERKFDAAGRRQFVEQSDGLGETLEVGLLRRDFQAVETATEGLQKLLWALGVTQEEGLERVLRLARTFGCVGKQSGAGGGDGAILFCPDSAAQRSVLDAFSSRGIYAFAIAPDRGLQGEVVRHPVLSGWLDAL
jgi:phosphomevalonate kinase